MHSRIYEGTIRHRRFRPRANTFQYRLFFMYLDLDELPTLFDMHPLWSYEKPNIAFFRRRDHFGDPSLPLDIAVRDLVEKKVGTRPNGPIRLLTHLRYVGHCETGRQRERLLQARQADVDPVGVDVDSRTGHRGDGIDEKHHVGVVPHHIGDQRRM